MPSAKAVPQFEAFGAYVDPFGASQTVLTLWADCWRTAAQSTIWWTERWLQAATAMIPAATVPAGRPDPRPVAAIIDLARAAAARTAAEIGDIAAETVEIAETAAEIPRVVAEEAEIAGEQAEAELAPLDDLTRLVGVGPKLAAALAQRGVTRFSQIAAWTEQDLAEVDKALDLKGRAVRDAWVAQARRMVDEA